MLGASAINYYKSLNGNIKKKKKKQDYHSQSLKGGKHWAPIK